MIDYYALLDVSPTAPLELIKRAYTIKAMQYHPDRNPSPDAEEKMKEINAAYDVLSNPQKREAYDAELAAYRAKQEEERERERWKSAAQTNTVPSESTFMGVDEAAYLAELLAKKQLQAKSIQKAIDVADMEYELTLKGLKNALKACLIRLWNIIGITTIPVLLTKVADSIGQVDINQITIYPYSVSLLVVIELALLFVASKSETFQLNPFRLIGYLLRKEFAVLFAVGAVLLMLMPDVKIYLGASAVMHGLVGLALQGVYKEVFRGYEEAEKIAYQNKRSVLQAQLEEILIYCRSLT